MATKESHNHINAKMRLFQTIRKNLAILCFKQNHTDSHLLLIQQHWSCFLKSALSLTSLFAYLIYVAETTNELMFSVFLSTASLFIFVAFTSTVFKTSTLYGFFDHTEFVLNESEYCLLHSKDLGLWMVDLLYFRNSRTKMDENLRKSQSVHREFE